MKILRGLVAWALVSVFFSSLLFLAYGWMFNETFGRRETVKSWFEDSGVYANFVDEIVAVSQSQAAEQGNAVDARTLADVANSSFTPDFLQSSLENVLDGGYDWLEGQTAEPEFTIDFTEAKAAYADGLANVAKERVNTLPVCSTSEETASFDPFSAACKPELLDIGSMSAEFKQLIIEDENFLPDPVLTASDIQVGEEGSKQTIGQTASALPKAYKFARLGPLIAIIAALLSGAGILYIAKSKRKGLFKLFRGFVFTSLSLALFTYITSRSTSWLDNMLAIDDSAQGFTERIVKPLLSTAADDLTRWTFRFMLIYAVIAAMLLLIYIGIYKKPKKSAPEAQIQDQFPHKKV